MSIKNDIEQFTIELRNEVNFVSGLDYLFQVPKSVHTLLLEGDGDKVHFSIPIDRDVTFLLSNYAELVLNLSGVHYIYLDVKVSTKVPLPSHLVKGELIDITVHRVKRK